MNVEFRNQTVGDLFEMCSYYIDVALLAMPEEHPEKQHSCQESIQELSKEITNS